MSCESCANYRAEPAPRPEAKWPFPWQRGSDKYNSYCADCGGGALVYDGHIFSYRHSDTCPNRNDR